MKLAGSLLAALGVSTNGLSNQLLDELKDGCENAFQYVPLSTRKHAKTNRKLSVEDIAFSFDITFIRYESYHTMTFLS